VSQHLAGELDRDPVHEVEGLASRQFVEDRGGPPRISGSMAAMPAEENGRVTTPALRVVPGRVEADKLVPLVRARRRRRS